MPEEDNIKEEENDGSLSWDQVEEYVNERTKGGAAMSVIETEKIFSEVLKKLKFPGKDTDQRIISAKKVFSNYQALTLARSVYKKLAEETGEEISYMIIPDRTMPHFLSSYRDYRIYSQRLSGERDIEKRCDATFRIIK